ncbi:histidine kinase [Pseudonocardia nigra]|uniref:histidine kinase n=1 Tax=Pseudonocardia nigra TaxID=1921578 RepID=UPI001C5F6338|nr:histidine kinase [Pseudonocardia nigra]
MNRTSVAGLLRTLLVACGVAAVLVVVVDGGSAVFGPGQPAVLLPFVAVAVAAVGLGPALPRIDRIVQRLADHRVVTPYSALAEAAARIRAGSLEQALPGLAQVLADGTGATRAAVWLAVGDRLVRAAVHPPVDPAGPAEPETVPNLAVLLTHPDTDHVVPVLEGTVLRAALTIGKRGAPVTPADQLLVGDVANGAGLLLRGVALNAELAERVRLADDLAGELQASRQRLAIARDVERRRLAGELAHVTGDRLAVLRAEVATARSDLDTRPEGALTALARARVGLDELLDRFRTIARGVYPAVLRDQGPVGALDEVAADLPRPVRLTGGLDGRLAWEIESGLYYVAASAMHELAGRQAERELTVHLARADGRVSVLIDDPTPTVGVDDLRAALVEDAERLATLGGSLVLRGAEGGAVDTALQLHAWLPDQLEPLVPSTVRTSSGAS